jgi:hypothetical protein
MDSNSYSQVLLKKGVDGKPYVYQLYTPEQNQQKDPNLYLWVRRCELFTDERAVFEHFKTLGITIKHIEMSHELFPELTTITDTRGYKWYCCRGPIHGKIDERELQIIDSELRSS